MAGERGGTIFISSDQQHLLHKIRGFVRSLVVDISQGSLPIVSIDRYRTYCSDTSGKCFCGINLPYGKKTFSLEKENHARHLATRIYMWWLWEEDIVSAAHFILVVEKEAVFNRLANDRFGSLQMAFDSKLLSVPGIKWLGVLPSDLDAYHLPDRCLLPLTPRDKCKAEAMLERCYLHREVPEWRLELELMLAKGVKIEIEALSVTSFSFLSESYLPAKIQQLQC